MENACKMWMTVTFFFFLFYNTVTLWVLHYIFFVLQTLMDTNKTRRTYRHACRHAEKKEKSQPLSTSHITAVWGKKRLNGIKQWEMSMWVGRRVCWALSRVNRSRVRTAGRPTGSPQAAAGAPLHASPHPWCRPGQSLHRRPTLSHPYHRHNTGRSQITLR